MSAFTVTPTNVHFPSRDVGAHFDTEAEARAAGRAFCAPRGYHCEPIWARGGWVVQIWRKPIAGYVGVLAHEGRSHCPLCGEPRPKGSPSSNLCGPCLMGR